MRILMLHNRYLYAGGEEQATAADVALLKEYGHEVELLEQDNRDVERLGNVRTAFRTIWSADSYRRVRHALASRSVDVLHVQNFFPLWSPSVYYAAERAGVPVVQTLHNYRLMCINSFFYRENAVCEDCLGKPFPWPGVLHACYRQSRAGSSAVAAMIGVHRMRKTWKNKVNRYIAVSEFARGKYIEGGFPAERIAVRPNFVHPSPTPGAGGGGYALYAGRLSPEKGIGTMLEAWQSSQDPLPLKIIGDGPLKGDVLAATRTNSKLEYLGAKIHEEVLDLMRRAEFLVFPSGLYETQGRTIVESFSVGTPVLASALGERKSMVVPGKTGLHFPAGDVAGLREQVEWCSGNPAQVRSMRGACRAAFEEQYTSEKSIEALLTIYRAAQQRSSDRP